MTTLERNAYAWMAIVTALACGVTFGYTCPAEAEIVAAVLVAMSRAYVQLP